MEAGYVENHNFIQHNFWKAYTDSCVYCIKWKPAWHVEIYNFYSTQQKKQVPLNKKACTDLQVSILKLNIHQSVGLVL